MLEAIYLEGFSNKTALDIGLAIIKIAEESQNCIGVDIRRLNQQVFFYMSDGLSEDKNQWLLRKGNTARRFMTSSGIIEEKLNKENTTLSEKYGLDDEKYVAVAGAIPVIVNDVGLVATIAVTGLKPEEDHELIIEALKNGKEGK